MKLTAALEADDAFLRELHHRIRNNFQIITSLVSLQARGLPEDRRDELRFVEEHVQAMAAAYRIVRVTARTVEVVLADLVIDVVDSLRQIAKQPRDIVALELTTGARVVRIDQAIAMGLYLATMVPPYLDCTAANGGLLHIAVAALDHEWIRLSVMQPGLARPPSQNLLRQRLTKIYLSQLGAEIDPSAEPGVTQVKIHIPPRQPAGE